MVEKQALTKKIIHICIIAIIIIGIIFMAMMSILKYDENGEINMPFFISKISIISTVDGQDVENSTQKWEKIINQNNDIYLYVEKNNEYKKTETISSIILNNFKLTYVKYHFGYGKFVNFYNWDLDKVSNFYYTTKFIPVTSKILDKYKVIWELIIEPDKYKYFYSIGENNRVYHVEKSFYHTPQEIVSWVLLDVSYNFKKRGIPLNLINITDELAAISAN